MDGLLEIKEFRNLCCKEDRVHLLDIRTENIGQVNKAHKRYPKEKCVSTWYLWFSPTFWIESTSEMKELWASTVTDSVLKTLNQILTTAAVSACKGNLLKIIIYFFKIQYRFLILVTHCSITGLKQTSILSSIVY